MVIASLVFQHERAILVLNDSLHLRVVADVVQLYAFPLLQRCRVNRVSVLQEKKAKVDHLLYIGVHHLDECRDAKPRVAVLVQRSLE